MAVLNGEEIEEVLERGRGETAGDAGRRPRRVCPAGHPAPGPTPRGSGRSSRRAAARGRPRGAARPRSSGGTCRPPNRAGARGWPCRSSLRRRQATSRSSGGSPSSKGSVQPGEHARIPPAAPGRRHPAGPARDPRSHARAAPGQRCVPRGRPRAVPGCPHPAGEVRGAGWAATTLPYVGDQDAVSDEVEELLTGHGAARSRTECLPRSCSPTSSAPPNVPPASSAVHRQ